MDIHPLRCCVHPKDRFNTWVLHDSLTDLDFVICHECYLKYGFYRGKGWSVRSNPDISLTKAQKRKEQLKVPF